MEESENEKCSYECDECSNPFVDDLYFEGRYKGKIICPQCRISAMEDCLQRVQKGCSFPSTIVERVIRDTIRETLERIGVAVN